MIITSPSRLGAPSPLHYWNSRRTGGPHMVVTSPGRHLAAVNIGLTGVIKDGRLFLILVVHGGMLAASTIAIRIVGATIGVIPLPSGSVVLHPWLNIREANIIDAVTLPVGSVPMLEKELLGMARDLHRCSSGDKVLRDILPVATAVHLQTTKKQPVVR